MLLNTYFGPKFLLLRKKEQRKNIHSRRQRPSRNEAGVRFKLSKVGPKVISKKEFVGMGYKTSNIIKLMNKGIQVSKLDGYYLLFSYDRRNVLEKELQQYYWDMTRLSKSFDKAIQVTK